MVIFSQTIGFLFNIDRELKGEVLKRLPLKFTRFASILLSNGLVITVGCFRSVYIFGVNIHLADNFSTLNESNTRLDALWCKYHQGWQENIKPN